MIELHLGPDRLRRQEVTGPIHIRNVLIEGFGVVEIRIREEENQVDPSTFAYDAVLEYKVVCRALHHPAPRISETCDTVNWVLVGSDPSEYRCSRCTSWL